MLKVYLVRHAESLGNKKGISLGQGINSGLSEKGKMQALRLAGYFKDKKIKNIYSSDLKRAYETASIIGKSLDLPAEKTTLLRELNVGEWTRSKNAVKKWTDYYSSETSKGIPREDIRPPKGENSWDHMKRVKEFVSSIENIEGNIVVVAHSGTNKVFLGIIEGKDPDDFYSIKQDSACINELGFNGKNWRIIEINKTIK